jgi:hypothetical protein
MHLFSVGYYNFFLFMNLRIVVEWLTFLLLIREVLGSNLGQETGYPDKVFHGFPQCIQAKAKIVP